MLLYVLAPLLLAPFVQEDAAVFAAAGAAAAMMPGAHPALIFAAALLGLVASDTWKYWAGRWARSNARLRAWADKPLVNAARDKVLGRLGATLFAVRFIPGTRVSAYVAAGFFGAPFTPFFAYVVSSAALYIGLAFALAHALGQAAGERFAHYLPAILITAVLAFFLLRWLSTQLTRRAAASGS